MGELVIFTGILFALCGLYDQYQTQRLFKRRLFIETYSFSVDIVEKVKCQYPHLGEGKLSRVMEGLREYFILDMEKGFLTTLSMPSQVVDVALKEFLLNVTDDELRKLRLGFGLVNATDYELRKLRLGFRVYISTKITSPSAQREDGINHAWELCCKLETIDATNPARLPLLFALDAELDIPDGFRYSLDDCVRRYREHLNSRASSF